MQRCLSFWSSLVVELSVGTCTSTHTKFQGKIALSHAWLAADRWKQNLLFSAEEPLVAWAHTGSSECREMMQPNTNSHSCSPEILHFSCFNCSNYMGDEKEEKNSFSWEGTLRYICAVCWADSYLWNLCCMWKSITVLQDLALIYHQNSFQATLRGSDMHSISI